MKDVAKALEALVKRPMAPLFDSVEQYDGLAVFKHRGRVVGWMNWKRFLVLCEEMEKRK